MDFNPDEYLAGKSEQTPASDQQEPKQFDPDAYLNNDESEQFDPDQYIKADNEAKYNTPGQQLLTGVEGAGQGLAGPLATGAELAAHELGIDKALGIDTSAEAQRGRAETSPVIHGVSEAGALAASMLTGAGELNLGVKGAAKLASKLPEAASVFGKIGTGALKGLVNGVVLQGSDELSKAMLGQGDPEHPVASAITNMGASGLLGATTGGLFSGFRPATAAGLEAIDNGKYGAKANKLITGMGIAHALEQAGTPIEENTVNNALRGMGLHAEGDVDYNTLKQGINTYDKMQHIAKSKLGSLGLKLVGGALGAHGGGGLQGMAEGALLEHFAEPYIDKVVGKGVGLAGKAVFPAIMRAASEGNTEGLSTIMSYAKAVSKGENLLDKSVKSLFVPGQQFISHQPDGAALDKLKKTIEEGGPLKQLQNQQQEDAENSPQGFAEGGKVHPRQVSQQPDHIGNVFPEQNILLNTAKGRVYNYLNSMRPIPPINQLSFDTKHKNHTQERHYDQALKIASSPLSIIDHIKDGSVTPDQINHLNLMYPEVYRAISKRMTKHISEHQLEDKQIPYKIRQSMSMFLAIPLDSTFAPGNIQAIQATFAPKPQAQPAGPQQPQGKTKKGTTNLGKSNKEYLTPNQSAEADASKRD